MPWQGFKISGKKNSDAIFSSVSLGDFRPVGQVASRVLGALLGTLYRTTGCTDSCA
jgi:hypothetical protein